MKQFVRPNLDGNFSSDSAQSYKGVKALAKLMDLKYELLEHLLSSPDLAPSNFRRFTNQKKLQIGKPFEANEEVMAAVEWYLKDLPKSILSDEILQLLEKRGTKYMEVKKENIHSLTGRTIITLTSHKYQPLSEL